MYKKMLVVGLVASLSMQAAYEQELQLVRHTFGGRVINFISSDSMQAKGLVIGAGVGLAGGILYLTSLLGSRPSNRQASDSGQFAAQLKEIAAEVKKNQEKIEALEKGVNGNAIPASVVTREELNILLATYAAKSEVEQIKATHNNQMNPSQSVVDNGATANELNALKAKVAVLEESVRQSNQTKADKLSMFTQKLEALETIVATNTSQIKVLQEADSRKIVQK